MFYWIPYAFVRIGIFFITGILLCIYWPASISQALASGLFLFLLFLYFVVYIFSNANNQKFFHLGTIGLSSIFVGGYLLTLSYHDTLNLNHIIHLADIKYYQATVNQYAEDKHARWQVEVNVNHVYDLANARQLYEGKVLLYLPKKDFKQAYAYGDVLLIKGSPKEIQPPANPEEFDFKKYLQFKNIYHNHTISRKEVFLLKSDPPNLLKYYAIKMRFYSDRILRQAILNEREYATAAALILGIKDGLDNDLLGAYASTGAMHVLAVSGLHVAILYWMVSFFFKPLKRGMKGKWMLAIVSVVILWCYAFVTGLSPSVLRAVTMFSFMALAKALNQRTSIYNILAASAFGLLLFDPFMIMSLGFQLSYLAVLGIVYLQPALYRIWEPNIRLLDEIWKISSVAITAQLATFPLGLLYFHQFPNYFLLSNLFVIPLSFAVLIGGLGILMLSFISEAGMLLGGLLQLLIKFLNYLVFTVAEFPYNQIENIYISSLQCWILFGIVFSLILFIQFKKMTFAGVAAILTLCFTILQWVHYTHVVTQKKVIVYHVAGFTAIDLMGNGVCYTFSDSTLQRDAKKINYHITPNRLFNKVVRIEQGMDQPFTREVKGGSLWSWHGKTFLHIKDKSFELSEEQLMGVNYIIISNNAWNGLPMDLNLSKDAVIVLDSSNSPAYTGKFLQRSRWSPLSTAIYAVQRNGAFTTTI